MKQEPFIIERTYDAPIDRVWKALTDKDQMKQWYFDIKEFRPEVGFEFQFEGRNEDRCYLHLCKITEVITGKKLSYSWRYDGYDGNSFVSFELIPEGDKTKLKLTHEGLETFPSSIADFARENFVMGWTELIGSLLKGFVETGTIRKSLEVNASRMKVWEVLVSPQYTPLWASAFGEGVYVETDWREGSPVLWKDKDGTLGAKGIVKVNDHSSRLKIVFFDDVNSALPAPTGEYAETYSLAEAEGQTSISIEAGPLLFMHVEKHEPLWNEALLKIKELSEQKN